MDRTIPGEVNQNCSLTAKDLQEDLSVWSREARILLCSDTCTNMTFTEESLGNNLYCAPTSTNKVQLQTFAKKLPNELQLEAFYTEKK